MAEGYTSWNCPDLGNITIYSSDVIKNPDWSEERSMCPLVRPFGISFISSYENAIIAARTASEDYDSGILKICRCYSGGALTNLYLFIRIFYLTSTDKVRIVLGTLNNGVPTHTNYVEYSYYDFLSLPEYAKQLYVYRTRNRIASMLFADLPGYNGTYTYYVCFGSTAEIYIGTWNGPDNVYIYGHMVYTSNGSADPSGCLLSEPCAYDNAQSRSEQSEGVLWIGSAYDSIYTSDTDYYMGDYEGNYNNDPDEPRKKDPNENDPGGNSKPGGGDGGHNRNDNPVLLPDLPDLSISDTAMITLYKMSGPDMLDFTSYLFLDITQPGGAWAQMKNLLADPLDFIIGLRAIPLDPASTRASKPKFGTFTWPSAYDEVDQYMSFSCGTVYIEKYYGSCFDYDPYTKIQIFLPGVGFKELPTDDVMGMTIEVTYHIDVFTGDCVAFVHKPVAGRKGVQIPQIIAQFGGNIGASMPLARVSYDSAVQNGVNMISKALGFVTNAFTQAGGDGGSNVNAGALVEQTTMNAVQSMKRSVERSGTAGDSVGYMSSQKPYIVRTIPQQSLPTNYKELEGYPANLAGPLSWYKGSGFTTVEAIELQGVSGTDKEKEEILSILKGGVLI